MTQVFVSTVFDNQVRVLCVDSTQMVEKARLQHDLWPTSAAAFGRVMNITMLMASGLKGENEKITSLINGGGPIGTILVEAKSNGQVKGFVGDNEIYLKYEKTNKLAVGLAVGTQGYLSVSKDLGLKESFTGKVALQTGEIGDDYAYYFAVSEQVPSVVSLGVLVDTDGSIKASGGMLIQLLPGCEESVIEKVEEIAKRLKPISSLIDEGYSAFDIIQMYFGDVKVEASKTFDFYCDCSFERFERGIATLPDADILEMIEDDEGAMVKCEFCNKSYHFTTNDLKRILEMKHNV